MKFENPITALIASFLLEIGINIEPGLLNEPTFLPGIDVRSGTLIIDESKLTYPGDILHEAGHLAVISPERRHKGSGNIGQKAHEEMMAIAWSYAAAVHLDIDPAIVFHSDGYRGGGQYLVENFSNGRYIAVPTLQWLGMTFDDKNAEKNGAQAYPHMVKWVLD